MSEKDQFSPVPFSVMSGGRQEFKIRNGKKYSIKPMCAAHVEEFLKDNPSIGSQFLNLIKDESKKILDKWLGEVSVDVDGVNVTAKYCLDEAGNLMSLKKAMQDGWDLVDIKNYIKELCDISG